MQEGKILLFFKECFIKCLLYAGHSERHQSSQSSREERQVNSTNSPVVADDALRKQSHLIKWNAGEEEWEFPREGDV